MKYEGIVLGASHGGIRAISELLSYLPATSQLPVVIAQHIHRNEEGSYLASCFSQASALPVAEAMDKETIRKGQVYFAPPDYHLLIERDGLLSLSVDEKVNYSRPSIDILFKSAAYAWGCGAIGIILTGANSDGAAGLCAIKDAGGLTIAQDPHTAESSCMPLAAINAGGVLKILTIIEIGKLLVRISNDIQEKGSLQRRSNESEDTDS